ncbi:hypothetical protein [Stappia indica]|uniref:hypothetical protein n=1 Tax=Stappia indica TaxID=538381 RepID=UPI001CD534F2|nr:hypothetical protein [Stappia indica]MCA1298025.1 hypothetical protein [Stappia indica]
MRQQDKDDLSAVAMAILFAVGIVVAIFALAGVAGWMTSKLRPDACTTTISKTHLDRVEAE